MNGEDKNITVIGAGLAGSLLSVMLARKGYKIDLYEKRDDMRGKTSSAGKSINLALSHRGLLALEKLGIKETVLEIVVPMKGRTIHDIKGNIRFQPYGKDASEVINSISRRALNEILLDLAENEKNIDLYFNHKCLEYNSRNNKLTFQDGQNRPKSVHSSHVIAADGALSSIRTSILSMGRFNYSQKYLNYGYKELEIPSSENGGFRIATNTLHIWPRENFLMIALPNIDGSFTCTLFAPFSGEFGIDNLKNESNVIDYFTKNFPDAVKHLPNLVEDFFENPTGKLITIKCDPWNYEDKVLLVGDAAHAIIPFYGQGMNAAFEDCIVIDQLVDEFDGDIEEIFVNFSKIRKIDGDAIADLSYDNFEEMRDKVGDKKFLERKKIEMMMYEKFEDVISKYAMVTFHPEIPYHLAKIKGEILEKTISLHYSKTGAIDSIDLAAIREEIIERFGLIKYPSEI